MGLSVPLSRMHRSCSASFTLFASTEDYLSKTFLKLPQDRNIEFDEQTVLSLPVLCLQALIWISNKYSLSFLLVKRKKEKEKENLAVFLLKNTSKGYDKSLGGTAD